LRGRSGELGEPRGGQTVLNVVESHEIKTTVRNHPAAGAYERLKVIVTT
jgi:hypothetical protein